MESLCDSNLHNHFGDFASADHWGVGILGKKDDEVSRLNRMPRCGGVFKKLHIMAVPAVWRLVCFLAAYPSELRSRPQHTGETRCAPLLKSKSKLLLV